MPLAGEHPVPGTLRQGAGRSVPG
ncbi:MAG: hypothetical protein RLZZ413_51, partial [Pseudomonadota bacterium]